MCSKLLSNQYNLAYLLLSWVPFSFINLDWILHKLAYNLKVAKIHGNTRHWKTLDLVRVRGKLDIRAIPDIRDIQCVRDLRDIRDIRDLRDILNIHYMWTFWIFWILKVCGILWIIKIFGIFGMLVTFKIFGIFEVLLNEFPRSSVCCACTSECISEVLGH